MSQFESQPLIGLTLEGLRKVAAECGMPPFSAKQMAQWLYVKRITEIDAMTDLSKRARAKLAEHGFTVGRQQPLTAAESSDGTVKYLLKGLEAATSKASTSPTATAQHCACHRRPGAA